MKIINSLEKTTVSSYGLTRFFGLTASLSSLFNNHVLAKRLYEANESVRAMFVFSDLNRLLERIDEGSDDLISLAGRVSFFFSSLLGATSFLASTGVLSLGLYASTVSVLSLNLAVIGLTIFSLKSGLYLIHGIASKANDIGKRTLIFVSSVLDSVYLVSLKFSVKRFSDVIGVISNLSALRLLIA